MDLAKITTDKIQKQYQTLPSKLKDYAFSPELTKKVFEIGEEHNLHVDQTDLLHNTIQLTLAGLVSTDNFTRELEEILKVNPEQAQIIARNVDERVFSEVRQTMKDFAAGKLTAETEKTQEERLAPQGDLGDVLENRKKELEGVSQVKINKPEPATPIATPTPSSTQSPTPTTPPVNTDPQAQEEEGMEPQTQTTPAGATKPAPSKQQKPARTPGKTLYQGDDPYREPVS